MVFAIIGTSRLLSECVHRSSAIFSLSMQMVDIDLIHHPLHDEQSKRITSIALCRNCLDVNTLAHVLDEAKKCRFKKSPHSSANTVYQMHIRHHKPCIDSFFKIYSDTIRPIVERTYNVITVDWNDVNDMAGFKAAFNDVFVAKYEPGRNSYLQYHRDGADFGFVIPLNESNNGTIYPHFQNFKTSLQVGDMAVHPGFILHGSTPTTNTRYIISGFINVQSLDRINKPVFPYRTRVKAVAKLEKQYGLTAECDIRLAKLYMSGN